MTAGPVVTSVDGVRLRTVVHGGEGPVLLLQHGVGSSTTFLEEALVPPLVALGWRVVCAPVRGHDGADPVVDPADHALPLLAHDVAALVHGTGAVVCGGVSIGAHAAAAAVASCAVPDGTRVLAVLPSWVGDSTPGAGPHAAVAAEVRSVGVEGMWARLAADPTLLRWLRRVLLRDLARHDPVSLAAALVALDGARAPTLEQLRSLPVGCAVVGWDGDPGHPLEVAHRWAMAAPAASFASLAVTDLDARLDLLGEAAATALGPPS